MAITGEIKNLYSDRERTNALFPRTKVSAVSDDSGRGLGVIIEDIEGSVETIQTQLNTKQDIIEYGDTLPAAGTVGRIFFKKVSS